MISFFRYQDPLRFTLVFLFLLLIRLPVFIFDYPQLIPELIWDLVGAKMTEGSTMYLDIRESLPPFSAGTYYLINLLFSDTHTAYKVLSFLLVFLQALLFNFIVNVNNLYQEKTFVPAIVYIVLSSLFVDFFTLSTVMLGISFVILAFHFVFILIRVGDRDEEIFYAGALIGIATLFQLSLSVFLVLIIFVFLLYTPVNLRKYFILITGFFFPLLLTGTYYFLQDGLDEFLKAFLFPLYGDMEFFLSIKAFIAVLLLPAIILLVSVVILLVASRYINYQYVATRIFGLWLLFAVFTLFISSRLSVYHAYVFIPALAFFAAHMFLLIRHNLIREISFAIFLLLTLLLNYGILYQFIFKMNPISLDSLMVTKPQAFQVEGKRILVLGTDKSFYKDNLLATPYLNYELSEGELIKVEDYQVISSLYKNFKSDMPDVIVDSKNLIPKIFLKIPELGSQYIAGEELEGSKIYYKK